MGASLEAQKSSPAPQQAQGETPPAPHNPSSAKRPQSLDLTAVDTHSSGGTALGSSDKPTPSPSPNEPHEAADGVNDACTEEPTILTPRDSPPKKKSRTESPQPKANPSNPVTLGVVLSSADHTIDAGAGAGENTAVSVTLEVSDETKDRAKVAVPSPVSIESGGMVSSDANSAFRAKWGASPASLDSKEGIAGGERYESGKDTPSLSAGASPAYAKEHQPGFAEGIQGAEGAAAADAAQGADFKTETDSDNATSGVSAAASTHTVLGGNPRSADTHAIRRRS